MAAQLLSLLGASSVHHFPYFSLGCSFEQFTAGISWLSSVGNHFSLSMLSLDEGTEF